MKTIDFSCKHDILIRNKDGSLQPMDEPFFQATKVADGVFAVLSDGDLSYLVEGGDEALVIDSGYGCGNIREFCQTLTEKPVRNIANTHDHFDHTANNCYFEKAYMTVKTAELATLPFPSFAGIDFPRDYPKAIIGQGDRINLGGGVELEVFECPDHAVGSAAFLERKTRILFVGDEMGDRFKMINGYVSDVEEQFSRIEKVRGDFDWLCAGSRPMIDAKCFDAMLQGMRRILAGEEGEKFGGMSFPKRSEPPVPEEYRDRKIYNRQGARPEDRKIDADARRDQEYKRVLTVDGIQIIYQSNKLRRW